MTHLALAGALVLGVARAALAEPAPIRSVELAIDGDEIVIHQQLVVSLVVRHALYARPRWETPSFEGFWAERLNGDGSPVQNDAQGHAWRTTTFRRALFPSRVGELQIGPSRLRFHDRAGEERERAVPGRSLRVREPPVAGRPEDFSGVVGALQIQVSIDGPEIELGRSLPVRVNVFGPANVWDVELPELQELLGDRAEVFASRPRLLKTTHGGRFRARRILDFEVVPRSTGAYEIPELAIPYYDPDARSYRVARSEPVSFQTVPRGKRSARRPWQNRAVVAQPLEPGSLALRAGVVLAVLAASGYGLAWWWRRSLTRLQRKPLPRPHVLLRRASEAAGSDAFPTLLRDALRAGIHVRHRLDPSSLTTEELALAIDDGEAIALLEQLDRLRFTRAGGECETLLDRVRAYVQAA